MTLQSVHCSSIQPFPTADLQHFNSAPPPFSRRDSSAERLQGVSSRNESVWKDLLGQNTWLNWKFSLFLLFYASKRMVYYRWVHFQDAKLKFLLNSILGQTQPLKISQPTIKTPSPKSLASSDQLLTFWGSKPICHVHLWYLGWPLAWRPGILPIHVGPQVDLYPHPKSSLLDFPFAYNVFSLAHPTVAPKCFQG